MTAFLCISVSLSLAVAALAVLAEQDPTAECIATLHVYESLNPIADKVDLGAPATPSFKVLTNSDKATDAEKVAIAAWAAQREKCLQAGQSWRESNMPPDLRQLSEGSHGRLMGLMADLYDNKLTYGEFARQRAKIADELRSSWNALVTQHRQEQAQAKAQADQLEAQRRATVLQYLQNRPALVPPIQFHPMTVPQPLNCQTRYMGNTAYTTCQ